MTKVGSQHRFPFRAFPPDVFRLLPILIFLVCQSSFVFPQFAECNVRVSASHPDLKTSLRAWETLGDKNDISRFRTSFPFLEKLKEVRSLVPREQHPLSFQFTLQADGISQTEWLRQLKDSGMFDWVEENRSIRVSISDPVTNNDPDLDKQTYHSLIRTYEAWQVTDGSDSVVVGVLDTGLDYGHPEFAGQVAVNGAEDLNQNGKFESWPAAELRNGVSGDLNGADEDGNGFADDVIGYDFTHQPRSPFGGDYLFPDADPMDDNNHGTLVSGIIAAKRNNFEGGSGIAPGCRLKVLRAFSASGIGEDDDISRAIVYAADNSIRILNFSFGDIYPSRMMQSAVEYALSQSVVMVASAGNGTGDRLHYPSHFPGVICVSASDVRSDGTEVLWPLSSFGFAVDLCAPGSGIWCPVVRDTVNDVAYGTFSGTSTAAPMVTAAVALLFSRRGPLSPAETRGLLVSTSRDILSSGWDHYTGSGRLDIRSLLDMPAASHVEILSPRNDEGSADSLVTVVGDVMHPLLQSWDLSYRAGTGDTTAWTSIPISGNLQVRHDTLGTWDVSALADGDYTLRLRTLLRNGKEADHKIRFTLDRTSPAVELTAVSECWDNNLNAELILFRSDDPAQSALRFRASGDSVWKIISYDRITRNGEFLLGRDVLTAGTWEYQIECRNAAGMLTVTPVSTFTFTPRSIPLSGFRELPWKIPNGYFLSSMTDLDNDGLQEVVMSRYDEGLAYGPLQIFEYNANTFTQVDEEGFRHVLIPKSVSDGDNDGKWEILASVNDSLFLLGQTTAGTFSRMLLASDEGNGLYAAGMTDTDGDGTAELVAKDARDYFILERNGSSFSPSVTLPDTSPDYEGSLAPRYLWADFDGDGKMELVFGDYDGDVQVWEQDGGNTFRRTFLLQTELQRAGSYLCSGDFDADGKQDIFFAVSSSLLRNADFEYDAPRWELYILGSPLNDSFEVKWKTGLYDVDAEHFNGATAVNADGIPGDEIIFSTFPRTYLIGKTGAGIGMKWFRYGDITTHHVVGDANGNGVNEFAIGYGDSAAFYEWDFTYTGPQAPAWMDGDVEGPNTVSLTWDPAPGATDYMVWRGLYVPGATQISLIDSTSQLTWHDSNLVSGKDYLYAVLSKNASLNPVYAQEFSPAVVLRPHAPFRLDSAQCLMQGQVRAFFSLPVDDGNVQPSGLLLDDTLHPISFIHSGDSLSNLLMDFGTELPAGAHTMRALGGIRDIYRGRIDADHDSVSFTCMNRTSDAAVLRRWAALDLKRARLVFDRAMQASVLDPGNYSVYPVGAVITVEREGSGDTSVVVEVRDVVLENAGYTVYITVQDVHGMDGTPITTGEGNTAAFFALVEDMDDVNVYPNPWKGVSLFEGITFSRIPPGSTVRILSASGRQVRDLTDERREGSLQWNLLDLSGAKVKPGVYLYRVEDPETGKEITGKLSIIE